MLRISHDTRIAQVLRALTGCNRTSSTAADNFGFDYILFKLCSNFI
jgi:hypothetical protein